jgi:chromosome segregation ATPase
MGIAISPTGRALLWESELHMWRYLAAILALLLGGVAWWGWRLDRDRIVALDRVTRLEAELAKRGVVVPAAEVPTEEKAASASPKAVIAMRDSVDVGKYLKMIDDLRSRAASLEKEVEETRISEDQLKEKNQSQAEELKRAAEQLASSKEDAQKQQRVSEALDTELKFKAQRLVQSETSEKLLQERLAKSELASKRLSVVSKDVEDLQRRREASLVTLERRYREVTDLYRNFSLNLQTRESPGQGLQAGDLSRIQTALQQAEEELRQLRSLNARVAELARGK